MRAIPNWRANPLTRAATYRRGVFLLLGGVVCLPYTIGAGLLAQAATVGGDRAAVVATAVVGGALALVPPFLGGTRELEIAATRALLEVDLPAPAGPLALETRVRAALWFALHLISGALVGAVLLIAVPLAMLAFTERLGLTRGALDGLDLGPFGAGSRWAWTAAGVVLLLGTVVGVAGLGALAAAVAPALLGPSPAEREAALADRERRLAERNRLARELHDSVGHALTATTLQAGAARAVFDRDPEFARRALGAIEELGRTAMDELDAVLGMLREGPAERAPAREGLAARAPAPGLADLDRLLTAEVTAEIAAVDVPAPVSREAYRIVQESLTNAAKHGAGDVRLRITDADGLLIEVTNRLATGSGAVGRGGRGLAGMRERVRLLGGELTAASEEGRWRVTVRLPVRRT